MFAVIAFICAFVAAILKLTDKHTDALTWLLIIGLLAASVELLIGWHRSGYYGRRNGGT
jgi:hypothetical protein